MDYDSWFIQRWGQRGPNGEIDEYKSVQVGPNLRVANTAGDTLDNFLVKDGHAGTVSNAMWAQETVKRKVRSRTMPDYPAIAKQLKITGKVKLQATISADGHVVSTHVVGGSPVLVSACADALKKWRYEPGPKETSEVVEFDFDGN